MIRVIRADLLYINFFFGLATCCITIAMSGSNFYIQYIFPFLVLASIGLMSIHYSEIYESLININFILLLSLWIFGMGRQLTYLFGLNSYFSYYGDYSIHEYGMAYLFTYLCIFMFYVGTVVNYCNPCTMDSSASDGININKIVKVLHIILAICLIPMLLYYYRLIRAAIIAGYGTRQFDSLVANTRYFISLLREWGVLSTIALLVISYYTKQKNIILHIFYIGLTLLSLLGGSRTEGLSMLLILLLLFMERNKTKKSYTIVAIFLMVLLASMIPYLFELRKNLTAASTISANLGFQAIMKAIHEMGGSEAALLIVRASNSPLQFGKSIFLAALNTAFNFLPTSFRPDFSFIGPTSLASTFSRYLGLNYGLGFSLFSEAFLNFSWFGCFLFLFIGLILSKTMNSNTIITGYISRILFVFLLFTIARRESKDLFTQIVYYWLPFELLLNRLINFNLSTKENGGQQ